MTGATAVLSAAPVPSTVLGGWLRRHRGALTVAVVVLGVLVVLTFSALGSAGHRGDLDPQNPQANGAQALARVLDQHGVPVQVVRRTAELARTRVDGRTTLLVTSSDLLGRASADGVRSAAGRAGAVVLADPVPLLVHALDLPVSKGSISTGGQVAADCDEPLVGDLRIDVGLSTSYVARRDATACFGKGMGKKRAALVVRVGDASRAEVPTYVVGAVGILANDRVLRADNAAAALRLLGQRDRLVWYVPDQRDVGAGGGEVSSRLPSGLGPALWLMLAALVATMVWRGRRLGPLVVEQLPVVVKAVESTQGRGRLYRRVRDRRHTAALLRAATVHRLETRLRIPSGSGAGRVAVVAAEVLHADPQATYDVLAGREVTDDATLVRLAADLSALERKVHDT